MKHWSWKIAAASGLLLAGGVGVSRLSAQTATAAKPPTRAGLTRNPLAARQGRLNARTLASKLVGVQSHQQAGLLLLFEYDPALSRDLDLDDNGEFPDNGDRALRQGTLWLSDRSGSKISAIGKFATFLDYLDISGEATGTDLTQTTDMFFSRSGQVRAGGFWDVDDGAGAPALGIEGATGTSSLRRYRQGQLIFLGEIEDNEELYLLAR